MPPTEEMMWHTASRNVGDAWERTENPEYFKELKYRAVRVDLTARILEDTPCDMDSATC